MSSIPPILKQIKVDSAWILASALFDSKGRIRRDHVMIEGRDEAHPEGSYFLELWDQGKRKREAVGSDAFVAADRAKHRQAELWAIRNGLIETPVIVEAPERTKISDALEKYIDYIQYHRSLRTSGPIGQSLNPSANSAVTRMSTRELMITLCLGCHAKVTRLNSCKTTGQSCCAYSGESSIRPGMNKQR